MQRLLAFFLLVVISAASLPAEIKKIKKSDQKNSEASNTAAAPLARQAQVEPAVSTKDRIVKEKLKAEIKEKAKASKRIERVGKDDAKDERLKLKGDEKESKSELKDNAKDK